MPVTLLDALLLIVVLISAMLAMIRGFTREVLSIASWVAAAAATYFFWQQALPFVQNYVPDRNIALAITIAGIFFVTLIIVSLITIKISDFILDSKAGPIDRTLGFIFGVARGIVLMIIAVLFLNFFIPIQNQPPWIADARSKPWLDSVGSDILDALPDDPEGRIMERINGIKGDNDETPSESPAATQSDSAS